MLNLKLRQEFLDPRLKGTAVDFSSGKSGSLSKKPDEFLKITYPSHDLLKTLEEIQPKQSRPLVVYGDRGQGKSHLLSAVYHIVHSPDIGCSFLQQWAETLHNPQVNKIEIRKNCCIIAESLELQRFKTLWELVFTQHPNGQFVKGKFEAAGTPVPSVDVMEELFVKKPAMIILDEFQTWYDGLSDNKSTPHQKRAFNFIQILSQIAARRPELLSLIVSVRNGQSDAAQQINRINPVKIDFSGEKSKSDRRKLLLHRLFENRQQISVEEIRKTIASHINEYFRLFHISQPDQERYQNNFIEQYPFSPLLLQLLDDQVLIAVESQETRDLLRILVDLYKNAETEHKISGSPITAGDFSLTNENSGIASLLNSVASDQHRQLRELALRNLQAVKDANPKWQTELPHCEAIISSLWLRSLSTGNNVGATAANLQLDMTRNTALDDNTFAAELATIRENSFNIHELAGRILFKSEENPNAKLLSHSRNHSLFVDQQDKTELAKQIRYVLLPEKTSSYNHVIVLPSDWQYKPFSELPEQEQPHKWDNRQTYLVIPEHTDDKQLGKFLKEYIPTRRNAVRFIIASNKFYNDDTLIQLARCVWLANDWSKTDNIYRELKKTLEKDLQEKIKNNLFEHYAILKTWNYEEPAKCEFLFESCKVNAESLLKNINDLILQNDFIVEEFTDYVLSRMNAPNYSAAQLLAELQEPQIGQDCIAWIGKTNILTQLAFLIANGTIAVNIDGNILQKEPADTEESIKSKAERKLNNIHDAVLKNVIIQKPETRIDTGIQTRQTSTTPNSTFDSMRDSMRDSTSTSTLQPPQSISQPASSSTPQPNLLKTKKHYSTADPTSGLNLLSRIESWGLTQNTPSVLNVTLKVAQTSGKNLDRLIRALPDGMKYELELDKEEES